MTTEEILEEIRKRGLEIVLSEDGVLKLRGSSEEKTPALLKALRHHRERIVGRLFPGKEVKPPPLPPRPREFLWRTGHTYTQTPNDPRHAMEEFAPVGAWWWRWQGESEWRAVPGRGGENCSLLPGRQPV